MKSPGSKSRWQTDSKRWGGSISSVVRGGSRVTFRWMPWLFDIQYWMITKFAPTRWLGHHLSYWFGAHGLMKLIAEL